MAALSSRHGTAFRLLRVGALLVACLVFLWGCEVSRSSTLGDVPEYLVLAGLAAVVGFAAAWFEIRAVRAGRRTVTMDDGRWRVVARVGGDGALVFVGHDEEPADSDDPEDAPSGWVWTFPADSIDAVRTVLHTACFPDDDPLELAELELLELLGEAAGVLDPVARADPGAWLHGHGVRGERHEWGVDPTQTTRTLPIVGTPLAGPVRRGAKRRAAGAHKRSSDETRRSSADSPGRAQDGSAGAAAERNRRDAASGSERPRGEQKRRPDRGAANRWDAAQARRAGHTAGSMAKRADGRLGSESQGPRGTGSSESAAERGAERRERGAAGRTGRRAADARSAPDGEAAGSRPARRSGEAAPRPDRTQQASGGQPVPGQDQRYSGPIRRRGVGRPQRQDPDSWWETADGPTDRTYREPPPPRLSNPRRRADE
ncbi:hypothetical protein [Nocardia asteroides]|uniref:hypothetical protein n=1 Tax=Nocardia asteroides TaxID=1824 RepID=UPI001E2C0697|nr:hypothetical protein [Nocardia asteroides]UGT63730.1 hypothetical protein LTT61_10645 [Nocardia asteroides]